MVILVLLSARAFAEETLVVGTPEFGLRLEKVGAAWVEKSVGVDGENFEFSGDLWRGEVESGWVAGQGVEGFSAQPEGVPFHQRVEFRGTTADFKWVVVYEAAPPLIVKSVQLTALHDLELLRVAPWHEASLGASEVARTSLQDIAAFYRGNGRGFFVSLDFPWSEIVAENGVTSVRYPAAAQLKGGATYTAHTVTLGRTDLSGLKRYGRDTGEVAAFDAYVQSRYTPRFERPMFVSCSIVNRYTMPRDGIVWYTYKDHPTLSRNLDLLKRDLELMPKLGIEYYQVFPGIFDWGAGDPEPAVVHEIVQYAHEKGVRIGDYSGCNDLFCGHYNEHQNTLERPEWRMQDESENAGRFCFGDRAFIDHYITTVTTAAREFGFELHCLDFLSLAPCFAANHGHPVGRDSLYHQVAGLVRLLEALNTTDPDMMTWSNSGNWSEFLPKLAWWNQNLYLTDPFIHTQWQGLNMTSLLDDARREQMVSLHYTHFVPYRFYSNCQYFFSQNSVVPDIRAFEYGALATLAVTPNLTLGEVRPWMDTLPAQDALRVQEFYKEWTQRISEHYVLWKNTWHTGDDPSPGALEIYSHARDDKGFVFVINSGYQKRTAIVPLDATLGFSAEGPAELRELYPLRKLALPEEGIFPDFGSSFKVSIGPRSVLVLEVGPAQKTVEKPMLVGLPGQITAHEGGFVLRTRGAQGTKHRFAVVSPQGGPIINKAVVDDSDPPQPKRLFAGTSLTYTGSQENVSWFDVTFRREAAPEDLMEWQVLADTLEAGMAKELAKGFKDGMGIHLSLAERPLSMTMEELGAQPLLNFNGAYIENAFSELQETTIHFDSSGTNQSLPIVASLPTERASTVDLPLGGSKTWWCSTQFLLPFMYTIGAEPPPSEHTLVIFPMRDVAQVSVLKCWINGVEVDAQRYRYPRNPALSTYWADLVGSAAKGGDNTMVLFLSFNS